MSPRSVKKDEKKREGDRVQKLFPGTLVGGLWWSHALVQCAIVLVRIAISVFNAHIV